MTKRALLAVVAAVAVLSAGIGWLAGTRIKSPAEVAAEQAPPEPSLITVPVEMRELSQRLVVRGTALANESTPLEVSSTTGEPIITRITNEAGSELDEGDVAIEVAGRPVIVLQGQLPVFRSFIPTLEGPDVQQLEEALKRLGFDPGKVDGIYDAATADAVEELYRDVGYKPAEPSAEDRATLKTERESVDQAEETLADAERQLTAAGAGPSESQRIELDAAVARAKKDLAEAEAAAKSTQTTQTTAEGGEGEDGGQGQEGFGPDEGGGGLSVDEAKSALALAEATRRETLAIDTKVETDAVAKAKQRLTEARSSFQETQATVDISFPASEIYFLPTLPRKVQSLTVKAGETAAGPVMTVTGSGTTVTSGVSAPDRRLIEVGDTAILEDDDLGIRAEAKISFIAESPGSGQEVSSDRYLIRIDPDEELPEEALNVSFRITIPVTSSGGEVMAVPLAALSAGTDGTTRVEVERSAGETELVKVNPGLKAEGFVQIDVLDGSLEEGDRVVVGRDLVLPGQDESSGDESEDEG